MRYWFVSVWQWYFFHSFIQYYSSVHFTDNWHIMRAMPSKVQHYGFDLSYDPLTIHSIYFRIDSCEIHNTDINLKVTLPTPWRAHQKCIRMCHFQNCFFFASDFPFEIAHIIICLWCLAVSAAYPLPVNIYMHVMRVRINHNRSLNGFFSNRSLK